MSHKETKEEGSKTESKPVIRLTGSMKRIKELVKADMAKKEEVVGKEGLVDLLGNDVVIKMYKAKIKYDKYCDKMLNRRVQSRITNCDVLNKKGTITLKVYREDWTNEVILNFKASDLHLEQDPLDKLNDCARKKRKHTDDIYDYFRSTKRYKSSLQYEDHPVGTMLNEPCLGMIMFNSHQMQDFVTIEDFKDFTNEMMYTV
ncbi:hypothetical protein Tco_0830378 [Tanacetum coccineum]